MTAEERLREIAERIRRRAAGLPEEPPRPPPAPPDDAEVPEPHWSEQDDDGEEEA